MTGLPPPDPFGRIWRASWILFVSVLLLDLAIGFLRPILPWLIGACAIAILLWVTQAFIRWQRSRW